MEQYNLEGDTTRQLVDQSSLEEILETVRAQKTSPGIDRIPAKLYKAEDQGLIQQLYSLTIKVWKDETIPEK